MKRAEQGVLAAAGAGGAACESATEHPGFGLDPDSGPAFLASLEQASRVSETELVALSAANRDRARFLVAVIGQRLGEVSLTGAATCDPWPHQESLRRLLTDNGRRQISPKYAGWKIIWGVVLHYLETGDVEIPYEQIRRQIKEAPRDPSDAFRGKTRSHYSSAMSKRRPNPTEAALPDGPTVMYKTHCLVLTNTARATVDAWQRKYSIRIVGKCPQGFLFNKVALSHAQ